MCDKRFEGRVAIVTGGGSGMGFAVSKRLVKEGAKVYIFDFNEKAMYEKLAEIGEDESFGFKVDVSDEEQVKAAVAAVAEKEGKIDFSKVRSANLDEYKGLAPNHEQSYRKFMQDNLFDHISIKPENTIVPLGLAEDVDAMCAAYEEKIEEWGGVDLQLLGIGHDGHIGFNEPDDHFPAATHEVKLTEMTIEANKRFFNSADEVPRAAFTMGIGTIMAARKIVMVVTGKDKREILKKTFWGPVDPQVPASILQFHPDVTLVCDEDAYPFN